MIQVIAATFEDGVFKPDQQPALSENARERQSLPCPPTGAKQQRAALEWHEIPLMYVNRRRSESFIPPLCDLAGPKRLVAEVGGGGGGDAGFGGAIRGFAATDALDPVGEVEEFAVGFVVEVGAAIARAEDQFFGFASVAFGMNLVAAAVEVERGVAAHELEHGAVAGVDERALEVDLEVLRVGEQRLDGVGRLPDVFADVVVAERRGL